MDYAEFQALPAYQEKYSGSHIDVRIINEVDPSQFVIGASTGLNASDSFEALTVEEAGEARANEIVQGRHSGSLSVPAFWTPKWNDTAPTPNDFVGKRYTVIESVADERPGAGAVLNVYIGATLSTMTKQFGARGLVTFDFSFVYLTRYNGVEWAALGGS